MKIELCHEINLIPLNREHSRSLFHSLTLHRSHFSRWLPFVNVLYDIGQTERFIYEARLSWEFKKEFAFAIVENSQAKGVISAKDLNWIEKSTELGYWLDPSLQNQGVMTEAVDHLTKWLAREFGFQIFWITCEVGNLPSQRVAIKAGFEPVGFEKRGVGKDEVVFLKFQLKKERSDQFYE